MLIEIVKFVGSEKMTNKLFLNIPYNEKDIAKKLNAKWDSLERKWYWNSEVSEYVKFAEWILENYDMAIIAHNNIYILVTFLNFS